MINFGYITKDNIKEHNLSWSEIPDHLYSLLIVGGSGSGQISSLFNIISHERDIDNIYLYCKDLCQAKYQLSINKWECTGLKNFNNPKAFIE